MSALDKSIHTIYECQLVNNIHWHSFSEVNINEPYYSYYYAEDNLYVICDNMTAQYWLTRATSPEKALQNFKCMLYEVMQAGSMVAEEYE